MKSADEHLSELFYAPYSSTLASTGNVTYPRLDLIHARDKEIAQAIIDVINKHVSFDPHGFNVGKPAPGIIYCTDELRTSLDRFLE